MTLGKDEFHLHLVDTAGQVPVWGRVSKLGVEYLNGAVQLGERKSGCLCGSSIK